MLHHYLLTFLNTILELIELYFFHFSGYFTFNKKYYEQIDGSPMENPASPVLANITTNYLMKNVMQKIPFDIAYIKVYVDDTSLTIPKIKKNGTSILQRSSPEITIYYRMRDIQ